MILMTEISKEYAAALFALAREQNRGQEFYSALLSVQKELENIPEYVQILSAPNIPAQERCGLLEQAFAAVVPEYVLSFLKLLCEKGQIRLFSDCVKEYELLYQAFCKVSSARVVSAAELTEAEKRILQDELERISGHSVTAQYEIDGALIGGMVVYMDDTVIDGSLRTKLKELKEVMTE